MSSGLQFASQENGNNHEEGNERLDLLNIADLTADNLSLPADTFLRAAISMKNQVNLNDDDLVVVLL